jgi:hypothetical protein
MSPATGWQKLLHEPSRREKQRELATLLSNRSAAVLRFLGLMRR